MSEKLLVIDGHAVVYRAFFAVPQTFATSRGELTNAVYGFAAILLKALQLEQPQYWAVSFDRDTPTFRHELFDGYKGTRPPMPDPLRQQFARVREVVDAFNMPIYEVDGFEADDVLGTLARQATAAGIETLIVTGDLDATQLVTPSVTVLTPRRGADDTALYDEAAVQARYGLRPAQIPDYKGLVGDKSDNIPGVRGIGEKSAATLLQKYGTIEGIYDHLDDIPERQRALLDPFKEQALASKHLASIVTDVPITLDLARCRIGEYDRMAVLRLFSELEFRSLMERLPVVTAAGVTLPQPAEAAPAPAAPAPLEGLFKGLEVDEGSAPALTDQTRGGRAIEAPAPPEEPRFTPPASAQAAPPTHSYVIDTAASLDALIERIHKKGSVAIDTETDAVDPISARLVGISLATEPGIAYYIPVGHESGAQLPCAEVLERLRPVLEDEALGKIAHNGKYDMTVLARHGVTMRGLAFDTMIAAYLLNPTGRGLGLKDLALARFEIEMTPITDLIGKGKAQISMAGVEIHKAAEYAAADADITLRLRELLEAELREKGLFELFCDVEMPLVPVLAAMELAGVDVDTEYLRAISERFQKRLDALALSIYEAVGHSFNINSPKQLATVLFDDLALPAGRRTSTGYSTDAEVLEGLRGKHIVVDKILEFRQLAKLKGTYLDGLPPLISAVDGRIHTDFSQVIAATGRLSSSNPNVQNIPIRTEEGREIRRAFVAAGADELLLAADYSQIELRLLAHLSRDPILVDAFSNDQDIHIRTAALVYGVPESAVTGEMRRVAKTVNYAVIYGLSEFGLSRETGKSRAEAAAFLENYNKTYADLYAYMERTRQQVRAQGYVTTLLGRRRYVPEVYSANYNLREQAERAAINMPVQGTAADFIKIAMVQLAARMKEQGLRAQLILQVHDELVFRAPKEEIARLAALVRETMENALPLDVPIRVDIKVGKNWLDMEDVTPAAARTGNGKDVANATAQDAAPAGGRKAGG